MAVDYKWPAKDQAKVIGTRHDRLDGVAKSTGAAKYTYDVNLDKMLIAKALGCPHGHCRITLVDTAEASKVPGVVDVKVLRAAGTEINWEGELIAVVAAETEAAAAEGVAKLKASLKYEKLPVFVQDENLDAAKEARRTSSGGGKVTLENEAPESEDAEIAKLLKESKHVVEGYYGIDLITHCCLEPHGTTVQWQDGKLDAYLSTQNVSGTDDGFAGPLRITANDVTVHCDYIGGGFGSKFAPDYWSIAAAEISKKTGRPVKLMLDRDQELKIAGHRPSGYLKVRLGADENGVVKVWDSTHWGTGGFNAGGVSHGVIPYVFAPKNFRRQQININANVVQARAWRAPNHPQACAISQTAYDDLAAKMGADSYDVFLANLPSVSNNKAQVYEEEMKIAARLMDWKAKWHAHGKGKADGSIVTGLGMAIHTWGGAAGASTATIRIAPDGGVETFCGTQDLGTGTRTVCAMVVAETLGLPVEAIKVNIGNSRYPASGASGGSTTVGGVSDSHRRAAKDVLEKLFPLVAAKLGMKADTLEAVGGKIQVKGDASKSLDWKEACALIGVKKLEATANRGAGLTGSGVGGVQMAEVAVDKDTGVVKVKKYVAVQDMGLIINRKTSESQIYGAVIMGIAYALFEQRISDPATGQFLNAELANYRLARLGDIPEIVIELYEPESERRRGVIGLGEPPVISPGAAISNAVANALGVRVPVLPMTPKRVVEAIKGEAIKGRA